MASIARRAGAKAGIIGVAAASWWGSARHQVPAACSGQVPRLDLVLALLQKSSGRSAQDGRRIERRRAMIRTMAIGMAALVAACAGSDQRTGSETDTNMAHVHIGHVVTAWQDTPDQMGLLPTAQAEAEVAAQHAGFAASRPDDLDWMKLHVGHVLHAIDPSVEPQGPGLGYGVHRAAQGVAQHVRFAADSEGASDNVKLHATHVETSAGDVVAWSEQVVELGQEVQATSSAAEAAPLVAKIETLTQAILAGTDADGDGTASWEQGEGGLAQAAQHMQFMQEGEGMA